MHFQKELIECLALARTTPLKKKPLVWSYGVKKLVCGVTVLCFGSSPPRPPGVAFSQDVFLGRKSSNCWFAKKGPPLSWRAVSATYSDSAFGRPEILRRRIGGRYGSVELLISFNFDVPLYPQVVSYVWKPVGFRIL